MKRGPSELARASFSLGFFSLTAQVIILRECFVSFYGSELNLGTVLASWLLWVGLGSLAAAMAAGGMASRPALVPFLAGLQLLAALFLPLSILLMRTMPLWAPVSRGEFPSPALTAATAVLFTAGPGFVSGAWFTAASLLPAPARRGAGLVYTWEALGALAGGLALTFCIVGRLDGMEAALIITAVTAGGALLPLIAGGKRYRTAAVALLIIVAAATAALLTPRRGTSAAAATEAWRWPGMDLVATAESPFGHLALVDLQGQKTLYTSGVPAFSFPGRRTEGAALHLPILAAGDGAAVLLVGGGLHGALDEILLHPVSRLDYLEADAAALPLVEPHLPSPLRATLADPRLNIVHDDARHWLRSSSRSYDVIILELPEPSTALFNRFYTAEFFSLLKSRMSPRGLISLRITASPNYGGGGWLRRNRSIYGALRSVFGELTVLAGDGAVLVARGDGDSPSVQELAALAATAPFDAPSARPEVLQTLLDPARSRDLREDLGQPEKVNRDTRPAAYFFHAIHRGSLGGSSLAPLLENITGPLRFAPLALPLMLFAAGVIITATGRAVRPTAAPSLAALTTGWAAMSIYSLLLFSYQTNQGQLYHRIGLLTALFMAGSAVGGFTALGCLDRSASPIRFLRRAETAFLLWCPFVGTLLAASGKTAFTETGTDIFYAMLVAGTGFLAGLEFPLFATAGEGAADAGGRYYFLDLVGAAAGALLVFLWILPLLGLQAVILFAAALKFASLTATLGRST